MFSEHLTAEGRGASGQAQRGGRGLGLLTLVAEQLPEVVFGLGAVRGEGGLLQWAQLPSQLQARWGGLLKAHAPHATPCAPRLKALPCLPAEQRRSRSASGARDALPWIMTVKPCNLTSDVSTHMHIVQLDVM